MLQAWLCLCAGSACSERQRVLWEHGMGCRVQGVRGTELDTRLQGDCRRCTQDMLNRGDVLHWMLHEMPGCIRWDVQDTELLEAQRGCTGCPSSTGQAGLMHREHLALFPQSAVRGKALGLLTAYATPTL